MLRRLRPRGLRSRVLLLLVIGVAAASISTLWNLRSRRSHEIREAHEQALRLTDLAAANQREIIDSARQLLTTMAQIPEIRVSHSRGGSTACVALVQSLLATNVDLYANIGVAETNGDVLCSALPTNGVVNMGDRAWFRRTIQTHDFQIGDFQTGRISKRKVLVAGYPVLTPTGDIGRVIFAELPVETIARFTENLELPRGTAITVLDGGGTVLARRPANEKLIGLRLPDEPLVRAILDRGRGTADLNGLDGVRRIHAFAPVGHLPQTEAYVSIGISRQEALSQSNRDTRRALLTLGAASTLIALFFWFAIDQAITRRLRSLAHAAERMTTGDFSARSGGPYGDDEVGQLAMTFDTMATVLEARERETEEHRQSLRQLADQLAAIHDIDVDIMQSKTLEEIADGALGRLESLVPADCLGIALVEGDGQNATLLAMQGRKHPPVPTGVPLPITSLGCVQAGRTEEFAVISDLALAMDDHPGLRSLLDEGFRSVASFSLATSEQMDGVLTMAATEVDAFSDEHLKIAGEVSTSLAIALTSAALQSEIRDHAVELEKRVEERTAELAATNLELEAFTYSASHDLQAPLRALRGFSRALIEDHSGRLDEQGKDFVRRISMAAERMDQLLQDLLSYALLGRAELTLQVASLDAIMSAALANLDVGIEETGATITISSPLGSARGHEATLVQIVTNVLSNALKFVSPGDRPRVHVWTNRHEGRVRLNVTDEGIGVPVEHRARIFRILERLHGTEEYPGTGIGLAIVEKGAHRMGGRVGVETGDTGGSTFWIELPEASEEP